MAQKRGLRAMSAPEVSAYYEGAKVCASFADANTDRTRMVLQALEQLQNKSKYLLTSDGKDELASILVQIMSESSS